MPSTVFPGRAVPGALRNARWHLMNAGTLPADALPPELSNSWLRSWQAGLQPCGRMSGVPHASGAQLARALDMQRELVAHARPVMEFLCEQTRDSDSLVILAGADGMLLHASGDPRFMGRAERVALRPGATWSEQYRGTNAIGTALADDRALVVHAQEHFLERNSFLTCAAAPIHAADGRLLGVLDVSGDHRGYHPHTLGLVRSAVRIIEHRLFETKHDPRHWQGLRLRLHAQPEGLGTVTEGLLAVRDDGVLAGASVAALSALGLQWRDVGAIRLDAVLTESLEQLWQWSQKPGAAARVVHTVAGQALWVKAESGRLPQTAIFTAVPAREHIAPVGDALSRIDTGDAVWHAAVERARKVAGKPIALLLQGESGVGKEVFARAVHHSGPRSQKPFVAVNCAALPEQLIEAELFGYLPGAFTGARREGAPGRIREAEGGTLFLDEIGDMPLALQARLLRVLQDREVSPLGGGKPVAVDFALVCATHRRLAQEIEAGRFREDLYYRLNGLTLQLPALRERTDFDHLLDSQLQALMPHKTLAIAAGLRERLRAYPWPGNMRQLSSVLRTVCALLDDDDAVIDWQHLPDDLVHALRQQPGTTPAPSEDMPTDLRSLSRHSIARALQACAGNYSEAARMLGIGRSTLYRKLRGPGLPG
ncbi:MAG: sigma-54-dependent Fis family transcriptional regulator [Burkholderiales bacterium]|nr:sigma-54-dependent Fis family transcriptional regulator [Burkholderiales bacterium]